MPNNNKENKNTKRQKRNTVLVILSLFTIAVTGIYYGIKNDIFRFNGYERTIDLPTINTKVKSASSDEEFYLSTDIVLTMERSKSEKYDAIYDAVQDAVSSVDYDRVSLEDFTYLKNQIKEALSDIVREEAGMNIYITDFFSSKDPISREQTTPQKLKLPVIK